MLGVAPALAILVAIIAYAIALSDAVRERQISLLGWSLIALGTVYGVGWAFILEFVGGAGRLPGVYDVPTNIGDYFLHSVNVVLFIVLLVAGWRLTGPTRTPPTWVERMPSLSPPKPPFLLLWLAFFAGVVIQWIYSQAYGGPLALLNYHRAIRAGVFTIHNDWSFLKPLAGLALMSFIGFWGVFLERPRISLTLLGVLLSGAVSLYLLYSWSGRVLALLFIGSIALSVLTFKRARVSQMIAVAVVSVFIAIPVITLISNVFGRSTASFTIADFLMREFTFPFASFATWIGNDDIQYRYFSDFFYFPLFFIPSSMWPDFLNDVSAVNTAAILGVAKGFEGNTTNIPVDVITLGYLQLGTPGVAVTGFLFGLLLRVLQRFISSIPWPGIRASVFAFLTLKVAVSALFYASPAQIAYGNVYAVIFLGALYASWRGHVRRQMRLALRSLP